MARSGENLVRKGFRGCGLHSFLISPPRIEKPRKWRLGNKKKDWGGQLLISVLQSPQQSKLLLILPSNASSRGRMVPFVPEQRLRYAKNPGLFFISRKSPRAASPVENPPSGFGLGVLRNARPAGERRPKHGRCESAARSRIWRRSGAPVPRQRPWPGCAPLN